MRETPKLFHFESWLHSRYGTPLFVEKVIDYLKLHRPQLAAVTVIAVSGTACVVGATQLSAHWDEVTRSNIPVGTVGNVVAHSSTVNSAETQDGRKLSVSAASTTSSDSPSVVSRLDTSTNVSGGTDATVTVNGETIPVPVNGSISKNIVNENGTGATSVQVSNGSLAGNVASSSVHIQVNSSSSSTGGETQ